MRRMRTFAPAIALVLLAGFLVPYQAWVAVIDLARESPAATLAVVTVLGLAVTVFVLDGGRSRRS